MTVEVFNHLKANKETAKFFASEIAPIICKDNTCKSCPMAFDVKLEANGITSGVPAACYAQNSCHSTSLKSLKQQSQ